MPVRRCHLFLNQTASVMDEVLFKSLYDRFFRKVFRFVRSHCRDMAEAEDLTHDVFLKCWKYRESFPTDIPPEAQLLLIARRTVINHYRKSLLRKISSLEAVERDFAGEDSADHTIRNDQAREQLQLALDLLPPRRREIFEKSRFEVKTYDEIAREMGISSGTVESQMVKALRFLRERLAHLMGLVLWFSQY